MLRQTTHALIAATVVLSGQAALAFHKYRFTNGLVLGTTLAAVSWYQETARRKGLLRSRVLILLAMSTAALKLILHHVAHVLAP